MSKNKIDNNKDDAKNEDKSIKLKAHQTLPVEYMKDHRGLILYHGTGSGKTITALSAFYQFDKNIVIIGPKSSKKAFYDDIKKMNLDSSRVKFYTFSKIKKIIKGSNIDILSDVLVIVDEAHNLRNETMDNMLLMSAFEFVYKIILLTATPVINYLNDLAVLVNIINNKAVLPTDIRTFNASYYNEETGEILNKKTLIDKLQNCISYYVRKKEHADYPEFDTIYREIDMNDRQLEEYRFYMKKFLFDQTLGSSVYTIDFENINARKKNFFLSGTRQLSNTINGESEFPKIQAMYKQIIQGPFPCVIYSNYLKNGVFALTPMLEKDNITYKTITGDTNDEKINYIVDGYNKGKYKILLITSAGSESLDLKNTRQIHIMEPHWNESRIKQVIGRVIRYKSHSELQPRDRHVTIYKWTSVFPKPVNNKSADQYLIELSKKKDSIFKHFYSIIKDVAIENHYKIKNHKLKRYPGQKHTRIQNGGKNHSDSIKVIWTPCAKQKQVYAYKMTYIINKYIYRNMPLHINQNIN
jgi:superfamily II DNA or RNA helicase